MEEKKEIHCKGCGKMVDSDKIRHIQIKTCCSMQNIPLCKSCWEKHHGQKKITLTGILMTKVLFLCTGNSCRSQMAEGFLKQQTDFEVYSAGTNPAEQIDLLAVQVMQEVGNDITDQKPKFVDIFLQQEFDYLITVCDAANESCPVFLGKVKRRLHIGFEDPHGKPISVFRKVRDEIKSEITELIKNVRD